MHNFPFYDFINANGFAEASIVPIGSDWSPRKYWRLEKDGKTALLMHSVDPDFRGHRLQDFIALNGVFDAAGLNVPHIFAQSLDKGILLIEDFGDITLDTAPYEAEGYALAAKALHVMHKMDTNGLVRFEDGYIFQKLWLYDDSPAWRLAWQQVWQALGEGLHVFSHMDYRAGNLHWMPEREGLEKLGILDYQTAQAAPFVYDLVNLLEDIRRNVPNALKAELKERFKAELAPSLQESFEAWYVAISAQFHFMILGQMAHSQKIDAQIESRIRNYLKDELKHPALAPVAEFLANK